MHTVEDRTAPISSGRSASSLCFTHTLNLPPYVIACPHRKKESRERGSSIGVDLARASHVVVHPVFLRCCLVSCRVLALIATCEYLRWCCRPEGAIPAERRPLHWMIVIRLQRTIAEQLFSCLSFVLLLSHLVSLCVPNPHVRRCYSTYEPYYIATFLVRVDANDWRSDMLHH